jgi:hypothetical protein
MREGETGVETTSSSFKLAKDGGYYRPARMFFY